MSRRSKRLGTVEQEDDRISTSSIESHSLYKEGPTRSLRRKVTTLKHAPTPRQSAHHSHYSETSSYITRDKLGHTSELPETDYDASYWGDNLVRSRVGLERSYQSKNGVSETQLSYDKSTSSSGYSSEEDFTGQPGPSEDVTRLSRWKSMAKSVAKLPLLLFYFPGRVFGLLYWWFGTTWYRLTTSASLLDVFILTRHYSMLKKPLIILLLLLLLALLGAGLWHFYPYGLGGLTIIPTSLFSVKHTPKGEGIPLKQEETRSQAQSLLSEAEFISRMESLERKFHSLEKGLTLLQQQNMAKPKETEVPRDVGVSREEIFQIFSELSSDREAALMDSIQQQEATKAKNNLRNLREEQQGNLQEMVQKMHNMFKDVEAEIVQLKTDMKSSATDDLNKNLVEVEGRLSGELLGIKEQLKAVRKTQADLSQQVETVPKQIQGVRDGVELLFPKWLRTQMEDGRTGPLAELFLRRDELQKHLVELERKILAGIATERNEWAARAHTSVDRELQAGGLSGITREEVHEIVNRAIQTYSEDRIGMVDYALESSGASVINTRCSETFETKTALLSLFGVPLWYQSQSPRVILQPDLNPGNCWAFRGSQGYAVIRLSSPIHPTAVTIDHIPRSLSPKATISSAPKDFSVYGLEEESQKDGLLLGNFTYNQYGKPIQTFSIQGGDIPTYQLVELRIQSNWGHPEYTCIYRFRVHGETEV
ncbi:hypothetical protein XENTR_v10012466 [Xenopus tropicalis]|uniref:SUN domain-containing protein 2 n=1 Tax=Xenopus tropicalis TaxID=8364 RepID=A0A6I8PL07_XENTR|nr:SUN domain-containing protein 2 [Xenopus tropicalis]KAE8611477.1 hypothetical protein XENTR_v10012466 [Xenopus tropicalis]KAE8611478.1 hypothetical protein XENTR_v10012466 [Xenopus tropicalis]